ncbi:MAG: hypothetical protein LBJ20_01220 [Candidatus Methanoplasma sp.]|jgi:hypothetical protein|nr:hypothetical protein [Candidatus Methanoplasma sp.]
METVPRNVKIGGALGFLGGIISVVCLAFFFRPEETALVDMGVYMLLAAMFFSLAGGLTRGGQWSWNILLLMTFLTISAIGCAVVFSAIDLYVAITLAVIGAVIVASLSMPSARTWTDRMRV